MEKTGDKPQFKKRNILFKILKWSLGITTGIVLLISASLYFFNDHICKLVLNKLNNELIEPIQVSDVDLVFWGSFPNLSVDLKGVYIKDKFSTKNNTDTLLSADNIRVRFNPIDLWNEQYNIKYLEVSNGVTKLKTNRKGESNYDIFKPTNSKDPSTSNIKLQHIFIQKLRLVYYNLATDQHYTTTFKNSSFSGNFSSEKYTLRADCELFVNQIKSGEVVLMANKNTLFSLDILVDNRLGSFNIPKAQVDIEGLPFILEGKVSKESLSFNVHSKDISLTDLVNTLSLDQEKDVKKYKGSGEVYFDLGINGPTDSSKPLVVSCEFGINKGALTEPENQMKATDISLEGKYSNAGGVEEEYLKLERINFRTAGGPFSGDLLIRNFSSPTYVGKAVGNVDLRIANGIFKFPFIDKIFGRLKVNTRFSLQQINESIEVKQCEGAIELSKVQVKLENDKRSFDQINGKISLKGSELGISATSFNIDQTDIKITGTFRNIFNYLNGSGDLNTSVNLISSNTNVADLGTTSKAEKIDGDRFFALPDRINGEVELKIGQLSYEHHTFNNILGTMLIKGRRLNFPLISCVNAGSKVSGNLEIYEKTPEIFCLSANVISNNISFKPAFKEWNNFDQSVITDKNLSGTAEAALEFRAPFDLRSGVILNEIEAKLKLKVYNGHLKDVASFKDIIASIRTKAGKLVLGNNNINDFEKKLNDLSFETLENTIIINKGIIQIPNMKIVSSAMEMDVSGTHTFENIVDYRFAFCLRDIKQENNTTEFGQIIDDQTGFRVFMRMHGSRDNPIIEWDKKAKSDQKKENINEAKQDAKSILKSEFGLFKKDSTVNVYIPKEQPKEDIKINFNPKLKVDKTPNKQPIIESEPPKKDTKIKKVFKNWKEQQEEEEKNIIKVNNGKGSD